MPDGTVAPFATRVARAYIARQAKVTEEIIQDMVAEGKWPVPCECAYCSPK